MIVSAMMWCPQRGFHCRSLSPLFPAARNQIRLGDTLVGGGGAVILTLTDLAVSEMEYEPRIVEQPEGDFLGAIERVTNASH